MLRMSWKPAVDLFTFKFNSKKGLHADTPRQLVSIQASMFDPFGWLSPFALLLRQLLQRALLGGRGWDSPLDEDVKTKFNTLAGGIPLLENLTIPRWWNTEETADAVDEQLHVFCDASANGYGAVAYRRVIGTNGAIHVTILCARSHVVPLNPSRASHHNSIPRLEMAAAEKAVELLLFVERALKRNFPQRLLWSDSESTLKMIHDSGSRHKAFFANRLSKIHAGSTTAEWNFVESRDNLADDSSRGIAAHETEKWRVFHGGPDFLKKPEVDWPDRRKSFMSLPPPSIR